jgi:hypothetical protein
LPTSEEFEKQKRKKEKNGEIESKNPSTMEGNNTMVGSLTNQFFFTNKPHPLFFLYIYVLIWDFYFLFFFFFFFTLWGVHRRRHLFLPFFTQRRNERGGNQVEKR